MRVSTYRPMSVPLRAALLMPVAALTVHQLRYYLAFGAGTPAQLSREGHGYLATVEPCVLLLTALALGALVGRLALAWSGQDSRRRGPNRIARTWILCALVLFALYCGQELAEGVFASGHPVGIAGILGHGGFLAAALALLVAGVLALALRTADELIGLAARHGRARLRPRLTDARVILRPPRCVRDWRLDPRSGVVAGRAPPSPALSTLP